MAPLDASAEMLPEQNCALTLVGQTRSLQGRRAQLVEAPAAGFHFAMPDRSPAVLGRDGHRFEVIWARSPTP